MRFPSVLLRFLTLVSVLLLGTAPGAHAQLTTGNLFAQVADTEGNALPGVTVTLSGQGAPQVQVTDAEGRARFLGLSPGAYRVIAELDGFSPVSHSNVTVNVGRSTSIELALSTVIQDTIEVTSESPLLDQRKITTGATVTQVELEKIPTARDPWVILQSVPGVLVDRVNVGGNESGQQSNFVGPGSSRNEANWAVDGVVITDPAARGASPSYYNFDAFEEMAVSTGGSDVSALTGGVQLNLVTKRGTNQWRGEGRYLVTDNSWQSDIDVDASGLGDAGPWNATAANPGGKAQPALDVGSATEALDDYGLDVGGPVVEDRFWIWGSYGVQDIEAFQLGSGTPIPDNTELESYAAKLNGQLTASNSAIAFYHYGDKVKVGRGASPTRPEATTWNQTGPTDIYKLEDTQIFSSNLYLTGMASYVGGGFNLSPIGGLGPGTDMVLDEDKVWHNSFLSYNTVRPQEQAKLDGSYFFGTGNVNHELKFGVGYRMNEVTSTTMYPGASLIGLKDTPLGPNAYLGVALHDYVRADEFEQTHVLLQDTLTFGNLTANVGLRYDLQTPNKLDVTVPANPFFSDEIPGFTRTGFDPGFEWESITPRVGVTYAVGEERDTLLRASYAQFADQLGTGFFSDLGTSIYRTGLFVFTDANGNDKIDIDQGEVGDLLVLFGDTSIAANQVDPNLDPQSTDELVLGVEHALLPELVIGANLTYRTIQDFVIDDPTVVDEAGNVRPHRPGDYALAGRVQGTLPDGTPFDEPVYALRDGLERDPAKGFFRRNSGIEQEYLGLSLTFNKRLSNRWMLRGFATWADWQYSDVPLASDPDPTVGVSTDFGVLEDGADVLTRSAASGTKDEVWINSTWSGNLSGIYQVAPDQPWGFNVSADVNFREGFAIPYRVNLPGTSAAGLTQDEFDRTVLVSQDATAFRNDDVFLVNGRIEKELTFSDFGLTIGADVFNVFDTQSVLQTEGVLSANWVDVDGSSRALPSGNGAWARDVVSPRIFRLGARFSFR